MNKGLKLLLVPLVLLSTTELYSSRKKDSSRNSSHVCRVTGGELVLACQGLRTIAGKVCITQLLPTDREPGGEVTGLVAQKFGEGFNVGDVTVQTVWVTNAFQNSGLNVGAAAVFVINTPITFKKPCDSEPIIITSPQSSGLTVLTNAQLISDTKLAAQVTKTGFIARELILVIGQSQEAVNDAIARILDPKNNVCQAFEVRCR